MLGAEAPVMYQCRYCTLRVEDWRELIPPLLGASKKETWRY